MLPEAVFMHRQMAWRSGVVLAALLSDLTPLQQVGGIAPPFLRYPRHGATPFVTWPQVMTDSASGVATTRPTTRAKHTNLRLAMLGVGD